MQVSSSIQQSYTDQYSSDSVAWRMTGAKHKAKNIAELSKNISFKNVLEVGCGEGSVLHWLSEWNFCEDMHGIEISESGIKLTNEKNIKHLKSIQLFDGYKIPFPDQHFDLIICSHVLEHVEHERVLLREIQRVSKYQIIEVPIDFSFYVDKRFSHFLSYGHINIYTPSLFRFLLKTESFDILKDKCYLYDTEILHFLFKGKKLAYFILKCKFMIMKLFPYLLGIKPSSYVVLTQKSEKKASIF